MRITPSTAKAPTTSRSNSKKENPLRFFRVGAIFYGVLGSVSARRDSVRSTPLLFVDIESDGSVKKLDFAVAVQIRGVVY